MFTLRPHWGYFVPHIQYAIGVGSFYTPGLGVLHSGSRIPDFKYALTVVNSHFQQFDVSELKRRFTCANPSNLSLALPRFVVSRCIRHYPLAMKPRSYPRRSFGWEQSLDTGLENHFSIEMCDIESHSVINVIPKEFSVHFEQDI